MDKKSVNVLAVGVGGQGIIRLSDILADAAFESGFDVKKSEIHGLSQRGGSVTSHIRWGEKVFTPVIMEGEAHFIIALEELEALRNIHILRTDGTAIINDYRVLPATVVLGDAEYPENIDGTLSEYGKVDRVDASGIAEKLGNIRAANTVLIGVLSRYLDFDEEIWKTVISRSFPGKYIDLNIQAFEAGRSAGA